MATLKIVNLNFSFTKRNIIHNFSFEFKASTIYALIGASGIGKSTLAQLIAGHLKPHSGQILLNGRAIEKPNREIFIVHQEDDLFPWLTVDEQLAFITPKQEEIEELLKIFKLDQSKNLYPSKLSGGMKKRLALIRALLVNPKVLILDETFSSLDIELIKTILQEMIPRWKKENMIVILITHQQNDLSSFIDQTINL